MRNYVEKIKMLYASFMEFSFANFEHGDGILVLCIRYGMADGG
ncbi:hypothetical protein [Selenomonas sp. AB3002]